MLSVFITPCTKPTRIQCADQLGRARGRPRRTSARVASAARASPSSGKCVRMRVVARASASSVEVVARTRGARSCRSAGTTARRGTRPRRARARGGRRRACRAPRLAGGHQRQRARGRHAEVVHGLAAQELAQRRAQHGAPVGAARVRRGAGALELQLPALAARVDDLAERDGAAVAELTGPVAELMAAVARGVRLHARQQRVAGEHLGELSAIASSARRGRARRPSRASGATSFGAATGVGSRASSTRRAPAGGGCSARIARQLAHEAVVEAQLVELSGHGTPERASYDGAIGGASVTRDGFCCTRCNRVDVLAKSPGQGRAPRTFHAGGSVHPVDGTGRRAVERHELGRRRVERRDGVIGRSDVVDIRRHRVERSRRRRHHESINSTGAPSDDTGAECPHWPSGAPSAATETSAILATTPIGDFNLGYAFFSAHGTCDECVVASVGNIFFSDDPASGELSWSGGSDGVRLTPSSDGEYRGTRR